MNQALRFILIINFIILSVYRVTCSCNSSSLTFEEFSRSFEEFSRSFRTRRSLNESTDSLIRIKRDEALKCGDREIELQPICKGLWEEARDTLEKHGYPVKNVNIKESRNEHDLHTKLSCCLQAHILFCYYRRGGDDCQHYFEYRFGDDQVRVICNEIIPEEQCTKLLDDLDKKINYGLRMFKWYSDPCLSKEDKKDPWD